MKPVPLLERETNLLSQGGLLRKEGRVRVGLVFPSQYAVAASSLGFQALYRWLNSHPALRCERFVLDYEQGLRSLEGGWSPQQVDVLALSVSFEPDLLGLLGWLLRAGIPPLSAERTEADPALVLGGAVTLSNPEPFLPFVDAACLGDLEPAREGFERALAGFQGRGALVEALRALPGFVHLGSPRPLPAATEAPRTCLPCAGTWTSPDTELADRFLVEITRGCPCRCHFCLNRHPRTRFRVAPTQAVLDLDLARWPRLGLVGAGVSAHPRLAEIIEALAARGHEVGLSSVRADLLDDRLASLLRRAGTRTLTVAADGLSDRVRAGIEKGVTREHLLRAAELAARHRFDGLRVYQMALFPGEQEADLEEAARDLKAMARLTRVRCSVSFLVPKRGTPLEGAPILPIKHMERMADRLRRCLGPIVPLKVDSPRETWLQSVLSTGDADTGLRALEAARRGGAWRDLLACLGPGCAGD
jgi:radical SAM superfamily enzyme YgiQ (UPF0313 family)